MDKYEEVANCIKEAKKLFYLVEQEYLLPQAFLILDPLMVFIMKS